MGDTERATETQHAAQDDRITWIPRTALRTGIAATPLPAPAMTTHRSMHVPTLDTTIVAEDQNLNDVYVLPYRIVLPRTVRDSPRNMMYMETLQYIDEIKDYTDARQIQHAMATVRIFGTPPLFITGRSGNSRWRMPQTEERNTSYTRGGRVIDSPWIAQHSPYLSLRHSKKI